jgi:hypothetical protein
MPTTLPHRRRADEKRSLARTIFDFLFNAVLVTSALVLALIVLVREEQYAFGRQQRAVQPIEQTTQQNPLDGGRQVIPLSN